VRRSLSGLFLDITVTQERSGFPYRKNYDITYDGWGETQNWSFPNRIASSITRLCLTFLVMRLGSKDLALTAEKDETPQYIEIKFVDEIAK
tara:strand:+ start:29 stop:301 length:273 start_codon:yes stop_codon:yes gene_type:complete